MRQQGTVKQHRLSKVVCLQATINWLTHVYGTATNQPALRLSATSRRPRQKTILYRSCRQTTSDLRNGESIQAGIRLTDRLNIWSSPQVRYILSQLNVAVTVRYRKSRYCHVMYKLLYPSIRVRTAPPVSVRVRTRVSVSFSFTVVHMSRGLLR